jgi:hypothetical protein
VKRCISSSLYSSLESNSLNILFSIQVIESSSKVYELEGLRVSCLRGTLRISVLKGDMILCGLCQYLLNPHFWFISSIYLDLSDHVKFRRCLTNKWIMDEEELL